MSGSRAAVGPGAGVGCVVAELRGAGRAAGLAMGCITGGAPSPGDCAVADAIAPTEIASISSAAAAARITLMRPSPQPQAVAPRPQPQPRLRARRQRCN